MLPNKVQLQKFVADTGTGSSYNAPVTLDYVALQMKRTYQNNGSGNILVGNAVLFIDAKHTLIEYDGVWYPSEKVLPSSKLYPVGNGYIVKLEDSLISIGSKITYLDKEYFITDVEQFDYERGKGVHHWEVILK